MIENDNKHLTVRIETTQGTWDTTFPKTTKIEEMILSIVTHFGFAANGRYELRLESDPDNALKSERTLVSYGIKDNYILIFTDLGIAV